MNSKRKKGSKQICFSELYIKGTKRIEANFSSKYLILVEHLKVLIEYAEKHMRFSGDLEETRNEWYTFHAFWELIVCLGVRKLMT